MDIHCVKLERTQSGFIWVLLLWGKYGVLSGRVGTSVLFIDTCYSQILENKLPQFSYLVVAIKDNEISLYKVSNY